VLAVAVAVAASRGGQGAARSAHDTALREQVSGFPLAAAGDIACDPRSSVFNRGRGRGLACRQLATSNLLVGGRYAAVLALGDLQYEDGAYSKFRASYAHSWGRARAITLPVPGNHEYRTEDARGYHRYFGTLAAGTLFGMVEAGIPTNGYYSLEMGGWHVVALNSNCSEVGGCEAGSPQERWLRADLAANRARCTLAYWHHPRFSSGQHGSDPTYTAFWQALYDAGAEVVLVGHDHDYERFAPQAPDGKLDLKRGIREFVVGTGGHSLRSFRSAAPNSEERDASSFGVLELTLGRGAYAWRFRSAVGSFTDRGSGRCH
jgi:acid phosphatase type 7